MPAAPLHRLLGHLRGPLADAPDADLLNAFRARRDEVAFAAIVRRHGPTVAGVCRQVLRREADVEDAFQATFLVLLTHASAVRDGRALGSWLFGVAHRVAVNARRRRARVEARERTNQDPPHPAGGPPDLSWQEASALLHTELDRLPDRFRLPLLLCYLHGLSRDEAAAELGWSLGQVKGNLERGRVKLRARLKRRGIALSAGLLAAVAVGPAAAALPGNLNAVASFVASGTVSPSVSALVRGVSPMWFAKLKVVAPVVLAVVVLAAGAIGLGLSSGPATAQLPKAESPAMPAKPAAKAAPAPEGGSEVRGQVLGPDGKPVPGAKLFVCDHAGKSAAPQPAADAAGRFRFALPVADVPGFRFLLAAADGLGVDWAALRPDAPDLTLRLPADVPVRGKVTDLEGKPIAGAAVRLVELSTTASGNLDEFLKAWAKDKEVTPGPAFQMLHEKELYRPEAVRQLAAATTAADGTFRLAGIGRDRGLLLGVRGPGIADHYVRIVTRPDFPARAPAPGQIAFTGPDPVVAVPPAKPIAGTVRDARTKEPVAGVRVLAYTRPVDWTWHPVEAMTDARGRYRLDGLAKARRHVLAFDPGPGAPHLHRFYDVSDTEGLAPMTQDAELFRGVVVRGQVTDRSTGRPVRARVVYAPILGNEAYDTTPGYDRPETKLLLWVDSREMTTGPDGMYRLTVLPGVGGLFVRAAPGTGNFARPVVPKGEQKRDMYEPTAEAFYTIGMGDIFPMRHLHAYRLIRRAADATELSADFALEPGASRRGRLLDPHGKELTGAEAINLAPPADRATVLAGAEFTALALNPTQPRRLLFWHRDRKLAGTVALRGDEPEPVTVTLRPLAAVTGQAVNKGGEPLAGYEVEISAQPDLPWLESPERRKREAIKTDAEGRFRLADLPADVPLHIAVLVPKMRFAVIRQKLTLEPGKTKDLGTLRGAREPGEP
jgi:RNA polymerase sigma factor (sigma-70 family)